MASISAEDLERSTTINTDYADNIVVRQSGYQPAYRRVFRTVGAVCVSIAMASPMSAIFVCSSYMVVYGGHWGLTWGWVVASILLLGQPLAIAELCSSMPLNGALYWWTAALAPRSLSRPLSFIVGWISILSNMSSIASFSFAIGSTYASLIAAVRPEWTPTRPQELGLSVAVLLLWLALNFIKMERFIHVIITTVIIVVSTTFIFVVGLPASHAAQNLPFATDRQALASFTNFSEWDTATAAQMTFFGAIWSITGWQSPAFVVEETKDAARAAPRAIVTSYSLMAAIGSVVCWIAAFCINNLEPVATTTTGLPMFALTVENWGLNLAAAFMIVCMSCTAIGGASFLFSISCSCAAFARDGGLPFAKQLSAVNKTTNMPITSAIFTLSGGFLILLFSLLPAAARIIYSLAVTTIQLTFAIPIALRVLNSKVFHPGPFSYGRFSIVVHIWALVFTIYVLIVSSFPTTPNWTIDTFNYNWVVAIGVIILAAIFWFAYGRKNFKDITVPAIDGVLQNEKVAEIEPALYEKKT